MGLPPIPPGTRHGIHFGHRPPEHIRQAILPVRLHVEQPAPPATVGAPDRCPSGAVAAVPTVARVVHPRGHGLGRPPLGRWGGHPPVFLRRLARWSRWVWMPALSLSAMVFSSSSEGSGRSSSAADWSVSSGGRPSGVGPRPSYRAQEALTLPRVRARDPGALLAPARGKPIGFNFDLARESSSARRTNTPGLLTASHLGVRPDVLGAHRSALRACSCSCARTYRGTGSMSQKMRSRSLLRFQA